MMINSISFDFSLIDDNAITVAIVGYSVVFTSLLLLFWLFALVPKIINSNIKSKLKKQGKLRENCNYDEAIQGDVSAAISTAIYLYFNELHDEESGIVTVKHINRRYSPWSSKIYSVSNRLNVR